MILGDEQEISPSMTNRSTGPIYSFVELEYDLAIVFFELATRSPWVKADDEDYPNLLTLVNNGKTSSLMARDDVARENPLCHR